MVQEILYYFAFKLPTQSDRTPPIVMTASYKQDRITSKDKVSVSEYLEVAHVMSMVLYSSHLNNVLRLQ